MSTVAKVETTVRARPHDVCTCVSNVHVYVCCCLAGIITNEVQEFRYDRPFHKGKKNKECEFAASNKYSVFITIFIFLCLSCYNMSACTINDC